MGLSRKGDILTSSKLPQDTVPVLPVPAARPKEKQVGL